MTSTKDRALSPSGVVGTGRNLQPEALLKGAREGLGLRKWKWRNLQRLESAVAEQELFYHPLWLGKVLTFADRPPFPPKQTPNVVFVDAVSGYRGVLERVPSVEGTSGNGTQVPAVIDSPKRARPYVQAVMYTVNRGYVMKKPTHELVSLDLVQLPIWKVTLSLEAEHVVYVNGVTGEPETYMARLWKSDAWRSLDRESLAPLRASS